MDTRPRETEGKDENISVGKWTIEKQADQGNGIELVENVIGEISR